MKAIIFTGENGQCAIYGTVGELPMPGDSVKIKDARMILRVAEVGFIGIGSTGPIPNTDTRITAPVPLTTNTCKQALGCTAKAAAKIDAWPNWR